jgi:hypothetical protein
MKRPFQTFIKAYLSNEKFWNGKFQLAKIQSKISDEVNFIPVP